MLPKPFVEPLRDAYSCHKSCHAHAPASMTLDLVLALALFAVSITLQAGPNNMLLMISGLNFGLTGSLPIIAGFTTGFAGMLLLSSLGIAGLFALYPPLYTVLKALSVVYLLYIAWRVASASPRGVAAVPPRAFTFADGFTAQTTGPQGWMFAISMVTAYAMPGSLAASVAIVVAVCSLARLIGASAWVLVGSVLRTVLKNPVVVRAFNIAMACVMVLSLSPVIADLAGYGSLREACRAVPIVGMLCGGSAG